MLSIVHMMKDQTHASMLFEDLLKKIKEGHAPTHFESQGDEPIYGHIRVENDALGSGSSGTVYRAKYLMPPNRQPVQCVVKFPKSLFEKPDEGIKIEGGMVHIRRNNSIVDLTDNLYASALNDFEKEWKNGYALHFGRPMLATGVADERKHDIQTSKIRSAMEEMRKLKLDRGYNHIHHLLAMDVRVPCLISEYFNMSLLDWARADPPKNELVVLQDIMPQIIAGIEYMHHCCKMAHMDIKPSNMLYKPGPTNGTNHCVLCDFGGSMDSDTPSGDAGGTIGYMAPEVETFRQKFVPKYADAFSFAASIMHMLHPQIPCGNTEEQKLMLDAFRQSEPPRKENYELMGLLDPRKDPAQRYYEFEEFARRQQHHNTTSSGSHSSHNNNNSSSLHNNNNSSSSSHNNNNSSSSHHHHRSRGEAYSRQAGTR